MPTGLFADVVSEHEADRRSKRPHEAMAAVADAERYFVIPLSNQKEGDLHIVGNVDIGEFYQFPEQGMKILEMLQAGETATGIKSRLAGAGTETVDVDGFIDQLASIGFIYPENQRQGAQERLQSATRIARCTFSVDPRIARAIFSPWVLAGYLALVVYAVYEVSERPELRLNTDAFYFASNRTPLLLTLIALSLLQTALHEVGHMLAAARRGIRSKYGIGNRLWIIVAESNLTGILALPKTQRYLPMLAGLLVDLLCLSLLTILLGVLFSRDAGPFTIQVVQALVLETVMTMAWQFNVFVKTDIYFVLCNYFSHPDLDRDARIYLQHLLYRASLGRFGRKTTGRFNNPAVLQLFSLVWVLGRIISLFILFTVFLPTIWQYIESAVELMNGPAPSIWTACDTFFYVSIILTTLGSGMYMWLRRR